MILTFTPNPCVDKTIFIDALTPGAKIRSQRYACIPGGKGTNVSRAVKALGGDTAAMIVAGGPTGRHVVEMIEQQDGIRCIPVWVAGMTRTITTVLEEPVHRQTALFEPGPRLSPEEYGAVLESFRAAVADAEIVTFNGAVQGPELRTLYRELIAIAHAAGKKTILDSYGPEFAEGLAERPYMVKPNIEEAEKLFGEPLADRDAQGRAIEAFHARGVELVVLSLGPEGALVSRGGERFQAVPSAIEEINAVGSGDSLVAGFDVGIERGWDLERMARLAVGAGTANAMSWDIAHFTREEAEAVAARVEIRK